MKCAYCNMEKKPTVEHIISCGILDLFPECNITFDMNKNIMHKGDPVIKDVCSKCNKAISYVDSYIIDIIKKYGLSNYEKESKIQFKYDYSMLQKALIKFVYNDMRVHNDDCSYFDKELINYILKKEQTISKSYISIFAGLSINTSPLPIFFNNNMKIQWSKNPIFFSNSMIEYIDYENITIKMNEKISRNQFDDLAFSYIFRFNSLQFIILFWNKDSTRNNENNMLFEMQYPYVKLCEIGDSKLEICTNEMSFHNIMLVNLKWDLIYEVEALQENYKSEEYNYKKTLEQLWKLEEKYIAESNPRKRKKQ